MKSSPRTALGRGLRSLVSASPIPVIVNKHERPITPTASVASPTEGVEAVFPVDIAHKSSTVIEHSFVPGNIEFIDIDLITSSPTQPRQEFKEAELKELSDSIRTQGVLQPILVRQSRTGVREPYELVAGERRWRAATLAGLNKVPAIIKDITDREALEIGLIENVQRENLNPVEQAQAYKRLIDEFSLTQQDVAERVGKDRVSVANLVRLLTLPEPVLDLLRAGKLSIGHAKAVLTIKEPAAQISLSKKAVAEDLSVRELEAIVARVVVLDAGKRGSSTQSKRKGEDRLAQFTEVLDRLRAYLGTKVKLRHKRNGHGRIEIEYFSEQELDRIIELICKNSY